MATRDYPTTGLTIHWDGEVCAHSRICASTLPQVFRPTEKPWIHAEAATAQEIAATIDECPSRALTYTRHTVEGSPPVAAAPVVDARAARASVHVHENGPLEVQGEMTIVGADGEVLRESRRQYFCRCGCSARKPFCDNSHVRVGFRDAGLGPP